MRVLNISTDRAALDPGSRTRERFRRYAASLDSLSVVVPGIGQRQGEGKLQIIPVGSGVLTPIRMLAAAINEAKRLLHDGAVVVTGQDPFEVGIIALITARMSGARLHVQAHIDPYDPYFRAESLRQRFQSFLAPFVLRRADRIRVVSPRIQQQFATELGILEESIDCIPIASDVNALLARGGRTVSSKRGDTLTVLALSRFVPQKNLPLLVRAFATLHAMHTDVRLLLVGSGPEKTRLEQLVSSLGISDVVELRPWTENPAELIATADIFALPSDYEGWGMTVVEAAALGTPVVMTDVGCAGTVIQNEESGLIVPVRDESAFAEALKRLVDSMELREKLARNARARVGMLTAGAAYDAAIIASWEAAGTAKPS